MIKYIILFLLIPVQLFAGEITIVGKTFLDNHRLPSGEVVTDPYISLLRMLSVNLTVNNNYEAVIDVSDKDKLIKSFKFLLNYFDIKFDVITDNISNRNTTIIPSKGPFCRKFVVLDDSKVIYP